MLTNRFFLDNLAGCLNPVMMYQLNQAIFRDIAHLVFGIHQGITSVFSLRTFLLPSLLMSLLLGCGREEQSTSKTAIPPQTATFATPAALRQAAEQGQAPAQYQLAETYFKAEKVADAVTWLKKSATQGYVEAQYTLGQLYREGIGVPKDLSQSSQWYQQAAAQNHVTAQYNLGVMAYQGDGVAQDPVQAYQWFSLVVAKTPQISSEAHRMIEVLKKELTPEQIAAGDKLVQAWQQTH